MRESESSLSFQVWKDAEYLCSQHLTVCAPLKIDRWAIVASPFAAGLVSHPLFPQKSHSAGSEDYSSKHAGAWLSLVNCLSEL